MKYTNKRTRNLLRGVGTILDILPAQRKVDYSRFLPKETDEEHMAATWKQVGDDLKQAIGCFSDARTQPKRRITG